jgi:hypothetical protein
MSIVMGKRSLGRPRSRWIHNIKMDLSLGLSVVDWIGLAQDRYRWRALVNSVMNNGVFWDVTPCGSYKNRRLGGT